MKKNIQKQKEEKGVVLIEAIMAVGILVTIFTASLALYLGSIGGMRMSNDQLVATYLAQDGMDQIIAKRQYNFQNFDDWLDGLDSCSAGDPCIVDYYTNDLNVALSECPLGDCSLYLDATGIFSHDGAGEKSRFSRSVVIEERVGGVEAEVVVTVSWKDKTETFSVPLTYLLYSDPNN
jgi:Tfp pilus assembly protein PilV